MTLYPKLILDALATVRYPGTGKNLVEAEMVADNLRIDGMSVSFSLIFEKPTDPFMKSMVKAAETAIHTYVSPDVQVTVATESKQAAREKAQPYFAQFGLEGTEAQYPAQLSGGEQQRVSIARALAKNPKLLLCDEPTGALDYQTGKAILKLLQDMCREKGMTVIVITHNSALTPMADRVIHIKNGTVSAMELNTDPTPVEEIEW